MSTIASPRPSLSLSSRRGSASSTNTITSTSINKAADRGNLRRNRAALRDYYGLRNPAATESQDILPFPSLDAERESELDESGFNPESYIQHLLSKEGLEGILRVEAGLVSDIRSLDGEKKALVYDNYSKLIAATDTIRAMREKMDPLTPTTSTLTPAISHIAETASNLSAGLRKAHEERTETQMQLDETDRNVQKALVRRVLAAPERIRASVDAGDMKDAKEEWKSVRSFLDQWQDVKGTEEVRRKCEEALQENKQS